MVHCHITVGNIYDVNQSVVTIDCLSDIYEVFWSAGQHDCLADDGVYADYVSGYAIITMADEELSI